ncbi:HNH endonuclease [Maricaulis sp. MIT060901]|uniref:HNH endonuclease n=1 Tax=Maricaulis sp. MIT060901 TaxID=3096993 RepID=UPI00399A07F1
MKRRKLTRKQKAELFLAYDGKCAACGVKLHVTDAEWDHIKERRMAVDEEDAKAREQLSNFQPLCTQCHREKTDDWTGKHAKAERQGGRTGQQARRQRKKADGSYRGIPSPANPWPAKGTRKIQSRGFGA